MHCSDCDLIKLMESIRIKNNIACCRNELVAYMEFVTGLVDDFETGIFSRDDQMALFDKYAEFNPPHGKCLPAFGCF